MKKKLLITGASGFIGSYLVEEALEQGFEVYAGIRKTSSRKFLQHPDIRIIEFDFSSPSQLRQQLKQFTKEKGGFDFIIHNAGITQANSREEFHTVNFYYTQYLVEAVKASGMPLEKFILISSLATYGPGTNDFKPIHVNDECRPISDYGLSKLKAAQHLADSGLPYVSVHPTGVYGPRDRGFFQFIKLVNRGFEPYVGKHRQSLSLIYVKDLARAVVSLLRSAAVNRSFLLSDGEVYDKEQIGIEAKKSLQKKTIKLVLPLKAVQVGVSCLDVVSRVVFHRLPFLNRQKLDEISSPNWLCSSEDIWQSINGKPQYNLASGIAETITWYKENKWL
ncbi:MAG TPA: NAD(P)-dependent oxidoreductase [Flavisolibacter sp.]|jgi:nucleoside-diphosphate-sugar epimerase|nr:NAD(P)-dependent oxidoreductase [Flavisolibacter sp.]